MFMTRNPSSRDTHAVGRPRGARTSAKAMGALVTGLAALGWGAPVAFAATTSSPSTEPLIQAGDIVYLGAFALPSWANGVPPYGTSYFEYGGKGLIPYNDPTTGKHTLYMEGHQQNPGQVAQVEVPANLVKSTTWSALPMANIVHNFVNVPSNPDPASCVGNPAFIYGMLPYNGRLIVSAACSYGGAQTTSHGVRSLDLSSTAWQGFYGFASNVVAPPRALGGPMGVIPPEWQSSFGGPAMTGNFGISVTGSTSAGPSLTVFNPDDVASKNPIPGATVLFYPLQNSACGNYDCMSLQNNVYNLTTTYGGFAFPAGSRSVLIVTSTGVGCYWYGGWDQPSIGGCSANDPALSDVKGPHAPPYQYQILAYDANDLIAVKNGTKQTYAPKPYAVIVLNGMPNSNDDRIQGAGYDPDTRRLYIAQDYTDQPRIEVYQINGASGTSAPPPPSPPDPPTGVTVQ